MNEQYDDKAKNTRISKLTDEILKTQRDEPKNTEKIRSLWSQLIMEEHGLPTHGIVMDLSEEEIEGMDKWYANLHKRTSKD